MTTFGIAIRATLGEALTNPKMKRIRRIMKLAVQVGTSLIVILISLIPMPENGDARRAANPRREEGLSLRRSSLKKERVEEAGKRNRCMMKNPRIRNIPNNSRKSSKYQPHSLLPKPRAVVNKIGKERWRSPLNKRTITFHNSKQNAQISFP